jgi:nitrile hydratase subunit beta
MDGIHDLGGKHGFGSVLQETDEPAFHARWEAAVFAMSRAGAQSGAWNNSDRFRHAVERIDPLAYLAHTYYGRWLGGIETMMVEAGLIATAEITDRAVQMGASRDDLIAARPAAVPQPLAEVGQQATAAREIHGTAKFSVDDLILTSAEVKAGHTRLPAYARGKCGRIYKCHDAWVYPDTNAHGQGENPCFLYTVEFTATELWGENTDAAVRVYLDLFEPYLTLRDIP